MTLRKLTAGELLAGAGAVALVVLLFAAPWRDGERALACVPALLALLLLTAAMALGMVAATAFQRSQAVPVTTGALLALLAAGMLVAVAVVAIAGSDTRWGAWAALGAVAAVLAGTWRALRTPERRV